jgi:3-deoxy-D-manno-octulosonate 8-phosphate phosphatase (KDO 8-P phosphatase)
VSWLSDVEMTLRNLIFVFDVDGVMTTGQFFYSSSGKVFKVFGPHDNDGLKMLSKNGLRFLFVTADKRGFPITEKRIVHDMGAELHLVNESDRLSFIQSRYGLENVVYMGDGYYDAPILKACFYGIAPNNARIEAKAVADFITPSNSGEGAVLDACLHVLFKFKGS